LTAAEFGALVGKSVDNDQASRFDDEKGSWIHSCAYYANVGRASPGLSGEIRVFTMKNNTPLPPDAIDKAGHDRPGSHRIAGIGNGVRVDPDTHNARMVVATAIFLVTVLATDATPSDNAWATAARAIVARLPGR
jgi:hypothetical protein